MKHTITAILAIGIMLVLAGAAQAAVGDVLSSAGWTATQGIWSTWPSGTEIKAFNGDGLTGLSHAPAIYDNWGPCWFVQVPGASQNTINFTPGNIWLMVNMQAVKTIGTINVWNFIDPVGYNNDGNGNLGAKNVDIYYAGASATVPTAHTTFAPDATWSLLMNVDLNASPTQHAPSLMSDSLDVTDFQAQYVLFAVNSRLGTNTASEGSVGISEIQFLEGAIPEPATMSLLAIGGLAALLKRRRA